MAYRQGARGGLHGVQSGDRALIMQIRASSQRRGAEEANGALHVCVSPSPGHARQRVLDLVYLNNARRTEGASLQDIRSGCEQWCKLVGVA